MRHWGQISFQDAASPIIQQLIFFHDHAILILILVLGLVGYGMASIIMRGLYSRTILQHQQIETLWTILPGVVLLFLAFPSLRLLYLMDEVSKPSITFKAIGHQWYWSYEYSDFANVSFDSYMVRDGEGYRLLETDHRAVIPMGLQVRAIITSADVIHSWALPRAGVKVDAVPGRLNQVGFIINQPGVYYGQCSEICGANHSFMPISVEVVPAKEFRSWSAQLLFSAFGSFSKYLLWEQKNLEPRPIENHMVKCLI